MNQWKRNLLVLSAAQFLSMLGMSFFLPFIPLYLREMGMVSQKAISIWSGILFSSSFLVLSLASPWWGSAADRWGRKVMVIRSMVAASFILVITSFAQNVHQLLLLRLIHGFFSGFVSAAIALVAAEVPEESLGFGLGLFQSAIMAGAMMGPFLGGMIQDSVGIRETILLGGVLALFGAVLVWLGVKESHKPDGTKPSVPILENVRYLINHGTLWPAAQLQFIANFSLMAVQPVLALFVLALVGTNTPNIGAQSGLAVSAGAFSMMLGAPLWGRVADRWGHQRVLLVCLFLSALLFIPQGLSRHVHDLILSRFFMGFFAAGISPSLQSLIAFHTPIERRSGIMGVSFSVTLLGNAFGPLMGGFLAAALGVRIPFFAVSLILFGATFYSFFLRIPRSKYHPPSFTPVG